MKKKFILFLLLSLIMSSSLLFANDTETKAFGDINFGDSPQQVKEKIKDNEDIKTFLFGTSPHLVIQDYKFFLHFDYYKGQLYRIRLRSTEDSADYFDTTIKIKRDILVKTISNQYSSPDYSWGLSILDMDNDYVHWSHKWAIDNIKTIKIGIGENDYNYYASLWIEYIPLLEEKENEGNKETEDSIEDTSNNF